MNQPKMTYQLTDVQRIVSNHANEPVSYRTLVSHMQKGWLVPCGTASYMNRPARIYDDKSIMQYLIKHKQLVKENKQVRAWKSEVKDE